MEEKKNFKQDNKTQRTNRTFSSPSFSEHGKIPPQAVELEEAVLGAIMLEKKCSYLSY